MNTRIWRLAIFRWALLTMSVAIIWTLTGGSFDAGRASASGTAKPGNPATLAVTCPDGQCFTDVSPSNPFFGFINALYQDSIISGFPCGGSGEPCDPQNRPYYRPNNNVTRGQMAKFVDNGRKNISTAVGVSLALTNTTGPGALTISSTVGAGIVVASGGIASFCSQPGKNCTAFYAGVASGTNAANFTGGTGVVVSSRDDNIGALKSWGGGTTGTSYSADFLSPDHAPVVRVEGPDTDNGYTQLWVNGVGGPNSQTHYAEEIDPGALYVNGNLAVTGSKSGYVVDLMQNVDSTPLEPGDVVVIVGNSQAVLGDIPVVTVKKATEANQTGVVGIVDQAMYVPDAATRQAYAAQQQAIRDAEAARNKAEAAAVAAGKSTDMSKIPMPDANISDDEGLPHAIDSTQIAPGGYANVVTLGAYKDVKVDASFGAVHAGDLLTTSPHAGYAMKVTDKSQAYGAVIGKALGDLEAGTGVVQVMVTLK